MRRITLMIFCVVLLNSCKSKNEEYKVFGKQINAKDAQLASTIASTYKTLKVGDSIHVKMIARVSGVCQTKGCWMRLSVDDENEVMVKFKDYGFFVPKDIKGKDVVVNGKAFVKEISAEEQQHYAEDAGQTKAEIAKIIEPKKTFSFEADGVLVSK